MSTRLLMIKLNHNNVKVVADSGGEDLTFFFQSFSLFKNTKQQDHFQSNSNGFPCTGLPFAQTNARNMLGFPSLSSKGWNFIYPLMHRFIQYYQAFERTWSYQFNRDVTVEQQWKATCSADETSCTFAFTIFVLLFQIYLLLSQRGCFGRRYWLTCRPIAKQFKQMLRKASEEDLCFNTSCFDVCW